MCCNKVNDSQKIWIFEKSQRPQQQRKGAATSACTPKGNTGCQRGTKSAPVLVAVIATAQEQDKTGGEEVSEFHNTISKVQMLNILLKSQFSKTYKGLQLAPFTLLFGTSDLTLILILKCNKKLLCCYCFLVVFFKQTEM